MINRNKWWKVTVIIPITVILLLYNIISDKSDVSIGNMLINNVLGKKTDNNSTIFILIVEKIIYLIVFNILYGNLIYEDFRYSSTYMFSRLKSRKRWFYIKSTELLGISVVYTLLFLITNLLICLYCSTQRPDLNTVKIFFMLFFKITVLISFTTLLINIISIRWGNICGFISVYSCAVLLIFLALYHNDIPYINRYSWLLLFNPMCNILDNIFNNVGLQIVFYLYNLCLVFISIIVGAVYINRFDVSLVDNEIE